jgi:hypothetical protein
VAGVIVLDGTVLIAYLDGTDPHHAPAAALLRDQAGSPFATSALTLAETPVRPVGARVLAWPQQQNPLPSRLTTAGTGRRPGT